MTVSELLRVADHLDPTGQQVVRKAYERAAAAHTGQRRLSGEDYVNHPLEVAAIQAPPRAAGRSEAPQDLPRDARHLRAIGTQAWHRPDQVGAGRPRVSEPGA